MPKLRYELSFKKQNLIKEKLRVWKANNLWKYQ